MGLTDFDGIDSTITSRKDIENQTFSKKDWKYILAHEPWVAETFVDRDDENDLKMFIELFNEILEDGIDGVSLSEDEIKYMEDTKDSMVEML